MHVAFASLCAFILALLLALVHFGDAPRQVPTVLGLLANCYFWRRAASGGSNYLDLGISTCFFVFVITLNL